MTQNSSAVVRRADTGDVDAVLAVLAEHQSSPPSTAAGAAGAATAIQQQTWARMLATADLAVYIAVRDGQAVGTAAMMLMPHLTYDCHPSALIEAVVVRYDHRRQGIGRQLVERAVVDARQAGALKVQLLSHKRHTTDGAHRLYETVGFRAEAEGFRMYLSPWRVPTA